MAIALARSCARVDRLAVDRGDHVAALAGLGVAALDAGVLCRAVLGGLDHERAVVDRQVELLGDLSVHVRHLDTEPGVLDLAALAQLRSSFFAVLTGTAKPMPTEPWPPPVAICELMPITRPLESSSGPPELPGLIDASVWITSEIWKPSGRGDLALQAGDDAGRDRAAVAERVPDRDDRIAHLDLGGVAERQHLEVLDLGGIDLERREVRRRVDALDLGRDLLAALLEADGHRVSALDDVRVREDRAVLADHEAGAGGLALLGECRTATTPASSRPGPR